jgi:GntR family transcriptional regulator
VSKRRSRAVALSRPVARYVLVANMIRDRILSGSWKDGEQIPSLDELVDQYDAARVTVRRSIQILCTEGLLSSHRGRRTFVTYRINSDELRPLYYSSGPIGGDDDPAYAAEILFKEKVKSLPPRHNSGGLPLVGYVRIKKIDSLFGYTFLLSDNYVAASVAARFPRNAERSLTLARLTLNYSPIPVRKGSEVMTIDTASHEEVQHLKAPVSSPIVRVVRTFFGPKNEILYYSLLAYRGERFRMERDLNQFLRSKA